MDPKWKYMTEYLEDAGYTCVRGSKFVYDEGKKLDVNIDRRGNRFPAKPANNPFKEPFFHQVQHKITHRQGGSDLWESKRKASKHPVKVEDVEIPPYLPDVP
jgi:hypothetical protein